MKSFKGLDAHYRLYLAHLSERGIVPFTLSDAELLLNQSTEKTKTILNRLVNAGWVYRIKPGLFIPAPPNTRDSTPTASEPWIIANALFSPCYIGGWDAISYWELTDQIFYKTFVYTSRPQKTTNQIYLNHNFIVRKTNNNKSFGLVNIWKENIKLRISDASRTMIDILDSPEFFGSSTTLAEIFEEYLSSKHCNINLLIEYALLFGNGAIIKRLGFLLEKYNRLSASEEKKILAILTKGNVSLVPGLPCKNLATKWRLWIPQEWKADKS